MAKVILLCGRICSGKTTYAHKLRRELGAVILSVDEITLALFGTDAGEKHDEYVKKAEAYIFEKSVEIASTGITAVLDIGLWQKRERDEAKAFYRSRGIECELHCIDITDEEWSRRICKRNADILSGNTKAYYVDEGLREKFGRMFEKPAT